MESTAAHGGDGLAQVRQTTEAQQQVTHCLDHQGGLPPVPYGGQTYMAWQDCGPVAQVVGRESRSGYTGKRPADRQVVCRPLVLFLMLCETPKKDPRIVLYLLSHVGASREFRGRAFERFTCAE